jgi:hypothetical protein
VATTRAHPLHEPGSVELQNVGADLEVCTWASLKEN